MKHNIVAVNLSQPNRDRRSDRLGRDSEVARVAHVVRALPGRLKKP